MNIPLKPQQTSSNNIRYKAYTPDSLEKNSYQGKETDISNFENVTGIESLAKNVNRHNSQTMNSLSNNSY